MIAYLLPGRYRRRLRSNARQAGYGSEWFYLKAAAQSGAMITEIPKVWMHTESIIKKVRSDDNHVIEQALAEKKGIIFLTPHLGCFEISARYVAHNFIPLTVMYKPPTKKILEPFFDYGRKIPKLKTVPTDKSGIREFMKVLKVGGAIGLLPDQAPSGGEGVWVDFFNKPAYTVTLPCRLSKQTGACIIMVSCIRLSFGRGWQIYFTRLPDLPETTSEQALLINQTMESYIRKAPTQYLWSYNRYKRPLNAPPPPSEQEQ